MCLTQWCWFHPEANPWKTNIKSKAKPEECSNHFESRNCSNMSQQVRTNEASPPLATWDRLWWVPLFTATYHHVIKVERVLNWPNRRFKKWKENPLHDFVYLILIYKFHQDVLIIDFKQHQWRPASSRLQRPSKTLGGSSLCPPQEPLAAQTLLPSKAWERNTQTDGRDGNLASNEAAWQCQSATSIGGNMSSLL